MTSLILLVITSFTAGLVAAMLVVESEFGGIRPIGILAVVFAASSVLFWLHQVIRDFRATFDEGWDAASGDDE